MPELLSTFEPPGPFLGQQLWPPGNLTTAGLLLAALLACWLLLMVRRREATNPRTSRRSPGTPNELARAVFEVAVNGDLEAYRGLFLAGQEARVVMGDSADAYLEGRTVEKLAESLATLGAMIPEGSHYAGVEVSGENTFAMKVQSPGEEPFFVGIGTFAKVGAIVRLREAAFA